MGTQKNKEGHLIMFPTPLADNVLDVFPQNFKDYFSNITHLVCEKPKTSRAFIKGYLPSFNLSSIEYLDYNKRTDDEDMRIIFDLLDSGSTIGYCLLYTSPSPRD